MASATRKDPESERLAKDNLVNLKGAQSCPTLRDPMDHGVRGLLQARMLERVVSPFTREFPQPRDGTQVSHTARRFFTS